MDLIVSISVNGLTRDVEINAAPADTIADVKAKIASGFPGLEPSRLTISTFGTAAFKDTATLDELGISESGDSLLVAWH